MTASYLMTSKKGSENTASCDLMNAAARDCSVRLHVANYLSMMSFRRS